MKPKYKNIYIQINEDHKKNSKSVTEVLFKAREYAATSSLDCRWLIIPFFFGVHPKLLHSVNNNFFLDKLSKTLNISVSV